MIKVIIVDDESIIRVTLQTIIDWNLMGMEVVGAYANGKQVIEHVKKHGEVHLIITDINMPIMNGLALIEAIRKESSMVEFLVISAYDDYDLVREAFKLGVNDYILKQEIESTKVMSILEGIKKRLSALPSNDEIDSICEMKKSFFKRIVTGEGQALEKEQVKKVQLQKQLQSDDASYILCEIFVDDYKNIGERFGKRIYLDFVVPFEKTLVQCVESVGQYYFIEKSYSEFILIIEFASKDGDEMGTDRARLVDQVVARLHKQVRTFLNITVSTLVSRQINDLTAVRTHYEAMLVNGHLRYGYGDDYHLKSQVIDQCCSGFSHYNNKLIKLVTELLDGGNLEDIEDFLYKIEGMIQVKDGHDGVDEFRQICFLLICRVGEYLNLIRDHMSNVFGKDVDYSKALLRYDSTRSIKIFMYNWLEWLLAYMLGERGRNGSSIADKAQDYIAKNYSNADLSVKEVSQYLGFSEKHFSTMFAKSMSMTYTQYLISVRIDMAKKLMKNSTMKVYEISDHVGYKNVEHFSRTFKKATGYSPKQYRKI